MYGVGLEVLFACSRFGASCSIDTEALEFILSKLLEFGHAWDGGTGKAKPDTKRQSEEKALRRLAVVSLEKFDKLSIAEIARVRQDSEGFHQWRQALEEGLLRIESGDADATTLEIAVRDSLTSGEAAVNKAVQKSSLLSKAKEAGGSFILGAMGSILAGSTTQTGLEAGAATAALKVLWEFFHGNKARNTQRALMKHYSLWPPA